MTAYTVHKRIPVPGTNFKVPDNYTHVYTLSGEEEVQQYAQSRMVTIDKSRCVGEEKRVFRCSRNKRRDWAKTSLEETCKFKAFILKDDTGDFLIYENEPHNHPLVPREKVGTPSSKRSSIVKAVRKRKSTKKEKARSIQSNNSQRRSETVPNGLSRQNSIQSAHTAIFGRERRVEIYQNQPG